MAPGEIAQLPALVTTPNPTGALATVDALNRVTRYRHIDIPSGQVQKRADYAYRADGSASSVTRYVGAGTYLVGSSTAAYDGMGRLTGITHAPKASPSIPYAYAYDTTGNRTGDGMWTPGARHGHNEPADTLRRSDVLPGKCHVPVLADRPRHRVSRQRHGPCRPTAKRAGNLSHRRAGLCPAVDRRDAGRSSRGSRGSDQPGRAGATAATARDGAPHAPRRRAAHATGSPARRSRGRADVSGHAPPPGTRTRGGISPAACTGPHAAGSRHPGGRQPRAARHASEPPVCRPERRWHPQCVGYGRRAGNGRPGP